MTLWNRTIAVQILLALTLALGAAPGASARTITIQPSVADTDEEFENAANTLAPGDTLALRGGVYSQNGRRSITCVGTPGAPIVIRSYPGERALLTRPADNIDTQNNLELSASQHLVLEDLGFEGGSVGVRFIGGNYITIQRCEIYGTGGNAIAVNASSGTHDGLVFRNNEIHHTGQSVDGLTEGEGLYLGCNNNTCRVTNSLIEGNYIHHLRATSGGGNDGIELKVGSGGNVIRNNVIHDTNIGQRFPGIFVYGGGAEPNIVEGNAIWNAGEAIQVVSDAVIRNNLIMNSDVGITAASHAQVAQMKDVSIVNNTIYGNSEGLYIRWSSVSGMVLANNAVYSPGETAVDASGLGGAGVTVRANHVEGSMSGASVDNAAFFSGGTATSAFVDAAGFDLWPTIGSTLVGAADRAHAPGDDFNGIARTGPHDVGAYETEGLASNPGWPVGPGFKSGGGAGDVTPPSATTDLRPR